MKILWFITFNCCICLILAANSLEKSTIAGSASLRSGRTSTLANPGWSDLEARVALSSGPRVVFKESFNRKDAFKLLGGAAFLFVLLYLGLLIGRRRTSKTEETPRGPVRSCFVGLATNIHNRPYFNNFLRSVERVSTVHANVNPSVHALNACSIRTQCMYCVLLCKKG